jgi:hypothetical protein
LEVNGPDRVIINRTFKTRVLSFLNKLFRNCRVKGSLRKIVIHVARRDLLDVKALAQISRCLSLRTRCGINRGINP